MAESVRVYGCFTSDAAFTVRVNSSFGSSTFRTASGSTTSLELRQHLGVVPTAGPPAATLAVHEAHAPQGPANELLRQGMHSSMQHRTDLSSSGIASHSDPRSSVYFTEGKHGARWGFAPDEARAHRCSIYHTFVKFLGITFGFLDPVERRPLI